MKSTTLWGTIFRIALPDSDPRTDSVGRGIVLRAVAGIWDRTGCVDGWVSSEISPLPAHDTARTLAAARALYARAGRPNLSSRSPAPSADEHRGDQADLWPKFRGHAQLDPAQEGVSRSEVVLVGEEKRHVDRNAGEDRLLDRQQPFLGDAPVRVECRRRAAQSAWHCDREADVQGVPQPARLAALAARLQRPVPARNAYCLPRVAGRDVALTG